MAAPVSVRILTCLGKRFFSTERLTMSSVIIPSDEAYPEGARLWVTLAAYSARDARGLQATARLRPATTAEAAQADARTDRGPTPRTVPRLKRGSRRVARVATRDSRR